MARISKVNVIRPGTPPVKESATIVSETPREFRQKQTLFRTYQVIWYILGIVETLLFLRFLFKLLGASIISPFVRTLYAVSGFFAGPFIGMFPVASIDRSVVEWATLVAMTIYALVTYGIVYLFQFIKPVDPTEVEEAVNNP